MEYESKTCESIHALFFSNYWCWFETQFWSDIHVYVGHNCVHLYVFCKTNHITVIGVVISHCSVHRRGKGHTNNFGSIENQETYESRLIRIELLPTGNGMILGSTHNMLLQGIPEILILLSLFLSFMGQMLSLEGAKYIFLFFPETICRNT